MERKLKITITVLTFLAFVSALVEITQKPAPLKDVPQTVSPPTPSGSPSKTQSGQAPSNSNANVPPPPPVSPKKAVLSKNVINKLPYSTKDFVIEYFTNTNQLSVTVYSPEESRVGKEVFAWLEAQGVKNPESLDILWSKSTRFIR